jgi:serine/threonine protein kinase
MNLYEFIKSNDFRGFSLRLIRTFTRQMLASLVLLKQHRVIHCDLKPENILLAHPAKTEIKVIDFGSSCFENEKGMFFLERRAVEVDFFSFFFLLTVSSLYIYPISILPIPRSHSWNELWTSN